jgi:hypothetical protein
MVNDGLSGKKETMLPLWIRITISGIVCSHWYIFLQTLPYADSLDRFFSFKALVLIALFCLILIDFTLLGLVWLTPSNKYLMMVFKYLRKKRWLVALTGIAILLVFIFSGKYPTSTRRIILYLNALILIPITVGINSPTPIKKLLRSRFFYWTLIILVALLPVIVSSGIINYIFHLNISDFHPTVWNDQIGYWNWARAFSQAGFQSGYNGWDESIAPAAFTPFGAGGPYYAMIYGTIGKIMGWSPALPIFVNMGLVAIALFLFALITNLDRKSLIVTGIVLITLWPISLFMLSSMHESMNHAIAIILAGVFFTQINGDKVKNSFIQIAIIVLLVLAAFFRITWGLLIFPAMLFTIKGKAKFRIIVSLILCVVLGVTILIIQGLMIPPTANIVYELLESTRLEGPSVLIQHAVKQISRLISHDLSRVIVVQLLVVLLWSSIELYRKMKVEKLSISEATKTHHGFNVYNLGIIFFMSFVFYLAAGFHRVLFAPLLLSVLVLISDKNYKPVYAVVVVSIILSQPYLNLFRMSQDNFQPLKSEFLAEREQISDVLIFDENTENRWCNTVLVPSYKFNYFSTMLPAGIGVSPIIYPENLEFPLKSRYLLFDMQTFEKFSSEIDTSELTSIYKMTLYHNLDADCP